MDVKEIKKEFKKLKKLFFDLSNGYIFAWTVDKQGVPNDKIYYGRSGAPRPDYAFTPYEIDRLEYTKPGLFHAGDLTLVGTNGNVLLVIPHKKKSNLKMCTLFNECIALYKQHNLGR